MIASTVCFGGIKAYGLTDESDSFAGSDRDDVVRGWAGDDVINGAGGADQLYGGAGNDIIRGAGPSATALPDLVFLNQNGQRNDHLTTGVGANMTNVPLTIEFLMLAGPLT